MHNETLRLKDGRVLGYSDRGMQTGTPVFVFHGMPGCRLVEMADDPSLHALGVRVIAPERPGYGLSTPQKGGSIVGFASDVLELANHIGAQQFHVVGLSGGSPFALACAAQLPSRVTSTTIVSGATPPEVFRSKPSLRSRNRIGFTLARFAPFLLKLGVQSFVNTLERQPKLALRQLSGQLDLQQKGPQTGSLSEQEENDLRLLQEAYRQGVLGHYRDMRLLYRSWGLAFDRIISPVYLWHGEHDAQISLDAAKAMVDLIPKCELRVVPGAGHLVLAHSSISVDILKQAIHSK